MGDTNRVFGQSPLNNIGRNDVIIALATMHNNAQRAV